MEMNPLQIVTFENCK